MKTFIVTGATQGLGLAIARALGRAGHRVVLAVRDAARGAEAARQVGGAEVRRVDMASLADVRAFAAGWDGGPIAGLVNNAGVQITDGTRATVDDFEETIAVNHLAAFELTLGLLPHLRGGGRVLFIGSGTHDPRKRTATRFGFRGARFTSVAALARGESDTPDEAQRGRDRYATSKLLNTVTAAEFARRYGADAQFYTLDPGPMPGTGLARTAPGHLRFVWTTVLPLVAPLLPGWSSTRRSAQVAAWLLTADAGTLRNGAAYDFDRSLADLSDEARDPAVARAVVDQSLALLRPAAATARASSAPDARAVTTAPRPAH